MKTVLLISAMLISGSGWAQHQLEVVVKNVKDAKGTVRVGIFKDDKTFLKEAILGKIVKAQAGEVKVVFDNVPAGTYGVSVIHDENENGELDSGSFGIPKEGFGFSNDAMGMFGPPSFEKASVTIAEKKSISVKLKYM